MKFSATIQSKSYDDPALFEVDAKAAGYKVQATETASLVKTARSKPSKARNSKTLYEPKGLDLGADVTLRFDDGCEIEGQVWSKAPGGCVWVATSWGGTFPVHEKTGEIRSHPEEKFSNVGLAA